LDLKRVNTISSSPGSAIISRFTFDQLWNKESIEEITAYRTSAIAKDTGIPISGAE
jgi:hypothetical protein